jgi:hypothetical protein
MMFQTCTRIEPTSFCLPDKHLLNYFAIPRQLLGVFSSFHYEYFLFSIIFNSRNCNFTSSWAFVKCHSLLVPLIPSTFSCWGSKELPKVSSEFPLNCESIRLADHAPLLFTMDFYNIFYVSSLLYSGLEVIMIITEKYKNNNCWC